MSRRIHSSLLLLVFLAGAFALVGTNSVRVANAAPATSYDMLSALPASDFIIYVDTQRVLTDVIPAILVERPETRAKLESELDKLKKHAGLDPRLLDAIAVGVNFGAQDAPGATFAGIARGRFDATSTIDAGLTLAGKESEGELSKRTLVYEGRTLYLLVPTRLPLADRDAEKEAENRQRDHSMAFVALDSNTVAFGNLRSVRATIDASLGRGRVDDELVQLATRTPNAAACFSGKLPFETARRLIVGNEVAESSVGAIKLVYGSFNTNGSDAEGLVNIRMKSEQDARQVTMALNALKFMAKIGTAQVSDKRKSIETMIRNIEIYAVGNEVQFSARVALTDIAPFVPKR